MDHRDNRGKIHELAFVILGFFSAILRSPDKLTYSKIHRTMKRDYLKLVSDIGCTPSSCISYSQLKRIMELFDYEAYNKLMSNILVLK